MYLENGSEMFRIGQKKLELHSCLEIDKSFRKMAKNVHKLLHTDKKYCLQN